YTTKIRKVGTSFGVLLPKELIKEQKLREGEEVSISVLKKKNIDDVFKMFGAARGAKQFRRDRKDRY
ncbi:MAG: AbrB/MazE/SpoVT family DNA-binding domain-containing protein, partial [Candidatus Nitrosotenuis sp.]